jgi:hypothetical protein
MTTDVRRQASIKALVSSGSRSYRVHPKRRRQLQLVMMMIILVFAAIMGVRALLGVNPPTLPLNGLEDSANALVVGDHEYLRADIQRINFLLQAKTYVVVSHPLQPLPTAPLPHRGIWLAYDPDTREVAVKLGQGLQTPPNTLFLLGNRLEPYVNAQVRLLARHPLGTGQKLHLMLNQVVQPYLPQATASMVTIPGGF